MSQRSEVRRRRRSRQEITQILEEFDSSGMPAAGFAAERGLSLSTFRSWLRRRRDEVPSQVHPAFVPVTLETAGVAGEPSIEVVLGNRRRVLVPAGFDVDALAAMLPVIDGAC
jgi:hypothetical protein